MRRHRGSPPVRGGRRWPGWTVAGVVAALAVSTVHPLWLGLSERTPWAQLVQLRVLSGGLALASAVVLAAVATVRCERRRGATRRTPSRTGAVSLVLLLVAAAHGGVLLSRGALAEQVDPVARAGDLTMLALNVEQGGPATDDVVALARRSGADVLALSEVPTDQGREVGRRLGDGGEPWTVLCAPTGAPAPPPPNRYSLLPYVEPAACLVIAPGLGPYEVAGPQPDLLGGAVLALPVAVAGADAPSSPSARPPLAVVHTTPPVPLVFGMERWRREVADAVAVCPGLDGAVVGGDVNASPDAAGLHRLGLCVDTAAGAPAAGTWPSSLPSGAGARIDHVLADGRAWSVVGTRVDLVEGTDHRALTSVLRPR